MSLFVKTTVSQIDIDHAREVLERANFKLGKARSRAIMSSAQASADAQDLQACVDAAAKAENEFAELAERFVTPAPADAQPVDAPAPRVTQAEIDALAQPAWNGASDDKLGA